MQRKSLKTSESGPGLVCVCHFNPRLLHLKRDHDVQCSANLRVVVVSCLFRSGNFPEACCLSPSRLSLQRSGRESLLISSMNIESHSRNWIRYFT